MKTVKMPENLKEKEKCLEKLNQMQKFLPFLDFMIEKINKRNSENSLECQLSKFHHLRSMIAEKNGKHSWDVLVKVEDVIQKLILKLGYQDSYILKAKNSEWLEKKSGSKDNKNSSNILTPKDNKTRMAAAVSVPSSTTTTISVTSPSSTSQVTTVDSKPFDSSSKTIDLVMKTSKTSVDVGPKSNNEHEKSKEIFSNSSNLDQPQIKSEKPEKIIETDLNKDLDGFELTECPTSINTDTSNNSTSSNSDKVTFHNDLLSSSREKLLKSLQKTLFPSKTDIVPSRTLTEKKDSDFQNDGFSVQLQNQVTSSECKNKTTFSEKKQRAESSATEKHKISVNDTQDNSKLLHLTSPRLFYSDNSSSVKKYFTEPSDFSSKQKLREKLSADICEVYRVSGKSVGGSLRSLKDCRKSLSGDEKELFKPDKITETHHSDRHSSENKNKQHRTHSSKNDNKNESSRSKKSTRSNSSTGYEKNKKKEGDKSNETSEIKDRKNDSWKKSKSNQQTKSEASKLKATDEHVNKDKDSNETNELDSLNDEELLNFVTENVKSLPYLSKLKSSELRKAIHSSVSPDSHFPDTESLSDDSFQDLDEFMNNADALADGCMNDLKEKSKAATENTLESSGTRFGKKVQSTVKPNHEKVSKESRDTKDLEESDFSIKLIEETTPTVFSSKKKKEVEELPSPKEVLDKVTIPENSGEPLKPPSSIERDPRRRNCKNEISNNTFEQKVPSVVSNNTQCDIRQSSNNISQMQCNTTVTIDPALGPNHTQNITVDGYTGRIQQNIQPSETFYGSDKIDSWSFQSCHLPVDSSQFLQYSNRNPMESADPVFRNTSLYYNSFKMHNANLTVCHPHPSNEPKSYAEYKRMKKQGQDKSGQCESQQKEKSSPDNSKGLRPAFEKEDVGKNNCNKLLESQNLKSRDSHSNQNLSKQNRRSSSNHSKEDKRKTTERQKCKNNGENQSDDSWNKRTHHEDMRKEEDDKRKKNNVDRKHSSDPEELVSPLEKLYENKDKPKTGRGYGLQNFKIPKKTKEPVFSESTKSMDNREVPKDFTSNTTIKDDSHFKVTGSGTEVSLSKNKSKNNNTNEKEIKENQDVATTIRNSANISGKLNTQGKEGNASSQEKIINSSQIECESVAERSDNVQCATAGSDVSIVKKQDSSQANLSTIAAEKGEISKEKGTKTKSEISKKCEAQVAECVSSVQNTEIDSKKDGSEKGTLASKEEITQELVESIIRNSFRSGEGKLLLAQAKLFEELSRKLNSKKLKTIQRIINSESGSSSSSDVTSEEEKKTAKSKGKAKSKKRKKKLKKNRKHKVTSSSESEESEEEAVEKKQEAAKGNNEKKDNPEGLSPQSENAKGAPDSSAPQAKETKNNKKSQTAMDFGSAISRKKTLRKQGQRELLEKILGEEPQEDESEVLTAEEVLGKDSEQKTKLKPKGKVKTELDRLHDDIRNMFICSGVVTATGQRMCRILRESGGNMNNLDIVKESAKMVKEEKLKKVQSRSSRSAKRSQGNKTKNQTQEKRDRSKSKVRNENQTENFPCEKLCNEAEFYKSMTGDISKWQPVVVLQRVNLNKFNYGLKISDTCISFPRSCSGNTAIRGRNQLKFDCEKSSDDISASESTSGVYLARNKRKCERLKNKKLKKGYSGKKLSDIVKNLPLKMSKMKHLKLCEPVKINNSREIKKINVELKKPIIKRERKKAFSSLLSDDLLNYAFFKRRVAYPCKLCSQVTNSITAHYKSVHPESEVLISRLNKSEAVKAITESCRNRYNTTKSNQSSPAENSQKNADVFYSCRMCNFGRFKDGESFFSHVSSHTGEYRYQCPAEGCNLKTPSEDIIESHILNEHYDKREILHKKVIKLFPLPLENGIIFGFLCSHCNFVQLFLTNVEKHIERQHSFAHQVRIIKINMSSTEVDFRKRVEKPMQNAKLTEGSKSKEENCNSNADTDRIGNKEGKEIMLSATVINSATVQENIPDIRESRKRKLKSEDGNIQSSLNEPFFESEDVDDSCEFPENKKFLMDCEQINTSNGKRSKNVEQGTFKKAANEVESSERTTILIKEVDRDGPRQKNSLRSDKDNDKTNSAALLESVSENQQGSKSLRVGPLEAQIFENSEILYECFVKGCLFSTKSYESFDKHINISHSTTEWDGTCELCWKESNMEILPTKSLQLSAALKHLKEHTTAKNIETVSGIPKEDIQAPKPQVDITCEEKSLSNKNLENKVRAEEAMEENLVSSETEGRNSPLPAKPLLRVRNLLGDRLSTPKDSSENENVMSVNKEAVCFKYNHGENSKSEEPLMFTIENVRSLKTNLETSDKIENELDKNEIKIQNVCSIAQAKTDFNQSLNTVSGKTVLVRSCPTRKIAIQPEASAAFPVEVGQIKVPTTTGQSLMLNPLQNSTPIRIIPSLVSLPHSTKFTVSPLKISTPGKPGSKFVSLVHSVPAPEALTPSKVEVNSPNSSAVEGPVGVQSDINSKTPTDAAKSSKTKASGGRQKIYIKSSLIPLAPKLTEYKEKKVEAESLLPYNRPNFGQKPFKDDQVYKEMLTKTKLCHLFKCMAVECSFTCNGESVFTQHIGLHEVQKRIKRQKKSVKTVCFDPFNLPKKACNWQQCAYCCEVLVSSSFALSKHIIMEHGHCIYQCGFCFYRAMFQNYVEIHQDLAHAAKLKDTRRVIYRCKPKRSPPKSPLEKFNRKQSVRAYHCGQCGKKFYITQDFMDHMTKEHQSVTAYTCHICKNLCFKADRLINHYKLHSYSTYQCAYCLHGAETEKEMMFHLCNYHFSSPPYMYSRILHEGMKSPSKELESLKLILFESGPSNPEFLEDADSELEIVESSVSPASVNLSDIAAELGITTENDSPDPVTPLMKGLNSIENNSSKTILVKSLLPNAEFSSENDSEVGSCSVLISSGLTSPLGGEKDVNVPLGQLPLQSVKVQKNEAPPKNTGGPLDEVVVTFLPKDKTYETANTGDSVEKSPTSNITTAKHNLPRVVPGRKPIPINLYPLINLNLKKKPEEATAVNGNPAENKNTPNMLFKILSQNGKQEGCIRDENTKNVQEKSEKTSPGVAESKKSSKGRRDSNKGVETVAPIRPVITNVVTLSGKEFEEKGTISTPVGNPEVDNSSIIISDYCSLSYSTVQNLESPTSGPKMLINILSKVEAPAALKPPIIRVEDFPIADTPVQNSNVVTTDAKTGAVEDEKCSEEINKDISDSSSSSPDVIILEGEKPSKNIETVTLDSEDEKENESSSEADEKNEASKEALSTPSDSHIRKEMERLRNQIANETDCLLYDDSENKTKTPETTETVEIVEEPKKTETVLTLHINEDTSESQTETLMSPIEEAICTLNKELKSDTSKEQENKEEKKSRSPRKAKVKTLERPRTRFEARREQVGDCVEKSDGEDASSGTVAGDGEKEESNKNKKVTTELTGADLFICGNEKCNFSAPGENLLKEHLFVCDLSRETSILMCPHCSKKIKVFNSYIEHLKHHGPKNYHCGLCEFSTAVENSVLRHLKQKHRIYQFKNVTKDPPNVKHLIFYPKNYRLEKNDFEVNGYSPGDEDKLPLQSVYQVNVKCAKCPYFTKVRSNMVRHLKIHVKSAETEGVVVVPSTAPTNPVPCLDTKEKMFDKMTNLAASSQLAQTKDKTMLETLPPEEETKLPQFVSEQMRYKCCLPDCNYITVDDSMLKHHIKALHDEINYYSCPHCKNTVHVDVRNVTLDKIGHHLKHHDSKLYKCAHCIYFHYQKGIVEKHTVEKHPDRRFFVYTVREPKLDLPSDEQSSSNDAVTKAWKCGLCNEFQSQSKTSVVEHLAKIHNTKSKYKCQLCLMKSNHYQSFFGHFASKHAGEKVAYDRLVIPINLSGVELQSGSSGTDSPGEHFDTTPLWQRGAPRVRHIRGILIEEEEVKTKKSKKVSGEGESEPGVSEVVTSGKTFYCPLCTDKKKVFHTRNADCFRSHLYQELNYQQFACILCGKMFVDKKDFDKHHAKAHPDKPSSMKQTKEDGEIMFWVDKVIAKQLEEMQGKKRHLSEGESIDSQRLPKKKKEV